MRSSAASFRREITCPRPMVPRQDSLADDRVRLCGQTGLLRRRHSLFSALLSFRS